MKKTIIVSMILILMFIVAACTQQTSTQSEKKMLKLGIILPLSGDASAYGLAMQKGIELAIQEAKNEGVEMQLVYEDTKCSPQSSATAIQKLVSVDEVDAIVGEACSSATLAAAPIAEQAKVVLLSPASTSPDIRSAGDYIFRVVPSDALQGTFGAELVYSMGYRKLAILHSNEDYGIGFKNVLKERFEELGGKVVATESWEQNAADAKTQLTKVKANGPDAVYIISNGVGIAGVALKQMKELGIKAQIFGAEGLKDKSVIAASRGGAEGMFITSVSFGNVDFTAKHKTAYNSEPGPFAGQAYDAVMAIAKAWQKSDGTRRGIKDTLYTIEFNGVSGMIKFDSNGEVGGNYQVYQVKDGKFTPYETG